MEQEIMQPKRESGQTVVLFALAVIGLIAFVGLAVDGGNVYNERRIVQNGADASALRAAHYIASSDAPDEAGLCTTVNGIVEGNGVPDSDGVAGNAVNDNIHIVYTNDEGDLASIDPSDGGPQVDCHNPRPSIPEPAQGVEITVDNRAETFFLGVIGLDTLPVGGDAVAVITGDDGPAADLEGNALLAFGDDCTWEDGPLDMSGHYVDVIGGVHSDSYYVNRGHENHYHGAVTYLNDAPAGEKIDPADDGVFDPPHDQTNSTMGDPFSGLFTVDQFACDGSIGSQYTCYDLESIVAADAIDKNRYKGRVSTKLLKDHGLLDETTGKLEDGIYYAGEYPFFFGFEVPPDEEEGLHGTVTLVSENYIKITEDNVQLTGYMPPEFDVPRLLMYSSLDPSTVPPRYLDRCTNFDDIMPDDEYLPINTTGNAATVPPKVEHAPGCYDSDPSTECNISDIKEGSLYYNGVLYAPYGRIATSGHGATYRGAIVAPTIRVNGYIEYCDWYSPYRCRPEANAPNYVEPHDGPFVGALFIYDYQAGNTDQAVINLNK